MRARWSTMIKDVRAGGVTIIWIEHVVHALLAVVDRLLVMHGGKLAEGEPHAVMEEPEVRGDLHGDRGRCLTLLDVRAIDASTATSRRCSASTSRRRRRGGRDHRRQRRRQDHLAENASPAWCTRAAARSASTASRSAALPARDRGRGIALVPEGRRLFPSLTVEENLLIGGQARRPGAVDARARLRALSRCWQSARHLPAHCAVRRPAADGGDRPRADDATRGCCCATRSASAWRRS